MRPSAALPFIVLMSLLPATWPLAQLTQEPPPPPPLEPAETAGTDRAEDGAEDETGSAPTAEEGVEPEVTIIQRRDAIIEEYRLNGQLYRIRVIPRWGPPYYLVPTNEAGVWRTEVDELAPVAPAQWLLFSW